VYAEATALVCKNVRGSCRREGAAVSLCVQKAWHVVSLLSQQMYSHMRGTKRRLRSPPRQSDMNPPVQKMSRSPFPEFMDVYGLLCTWNTRVGLDCLDLRRAQTSNIRGCDLVPELQNSAVYLAVWHAFEKRVQTLARSWGFPSWACCMEISLSAECAGRVHLHAFWGQHVSLTGWQTTHFQCRVYPEQLRWDGGLPDVQVMRNVGQRGGDANTCGGLYYCLAKKQESLFRAGNLQPFQDASAVTPQHPAGMLVDPRCFIGLSCALPCSRAQHWVLRTQSAVHHHAYCPAWPFVCYLECRHLCFVVVLTASPHIHAMCADAQSAIRLS